MLLVVGGGSDGPQFIYISLGSLHPDSGLGHVACFGSKERLDERTLAHSGLLSLVALGNPETITV